MTLRTVYCVQGYQGAGRRAVATRLRQFGCAEDALEAARAVKARASGVLVYKVEGEPDFGFWSEPMVLAKFGEVPRLACGD